jgi:starch synthase (maltosyl-transferring)
MIASLDAYYVKQAQVRLPSKSLGIYAGQAIRVTDLITGNSYIWDKEWNFVELHPTLPFHLFKIDK